MVAGAIAGVAEHTVMFPVDTVKTHVQCEDCHELCKAKKPQGVKGGIAQLFQKQFPDHVFTRAIESHGSTQQEFTCRESGQKYVLRINGAKVVESN